YRVIAYHKNGNIIGASDILKGLRTFPTLNTTAPPQNIIVSKGEFIDQIEIYWNSASQDTITRIYRSSDNTGVFVPLADVQGRSFVDKNVTGTTEYIYKLSHIGLDSQGNFREYFSTEYKGYLLKFPDNIAASVYYTGTNGNALGTILLTWEKNPITDLYRIFRSENDVDYDLIVPSTKTDYFLDASLPHILQGQNTYPYYYYKIQSIKNGLASELSDSYKGLAIPLGDFLAKPANFSINQGFFTWSLKWDSVIGAEEYRIYYRRVTEKDWFNEYDTTSLSVTYYPLSNQYIKDTPGGTEIIFQIRALKNKRPVGVPSTVSVVK
ncbi:MAG: hypothetical protein ACRCTJ_05675, partial [Brevinema sp.]